MPDEATPRICVICLRRQYLRAQACDPCRERLPHLLGEIADLYQQLVSPAEEIAEEWTVQNRLRLPVPTTNITRLPAWTSGPWTEQPGHDPIAAVLPMNAKPSSGGPRVTGSREAPVPVNIDLLDLTGEARNHIVIDNSVPATRVELVKIGRRHTVFTDGQPEVEVESYTARQRRVITDPDGQPLKVPAGDRIGLVPVATTLDQWCRDWRDEMAFRQSLPVPTVPVLARWLQDRCEWALDRHNAVDEFAADMRRLRAVLRGVLGLHEPAPEFCDGVVCKGCDRYALYRAESPYEAECDECGLLYTDEEYREWVGMLAAQARRMAA